jgi:phosphocarrier protein
VAEVVIPNQLGLHLRAAAAFAKVADRFAAEVKLCRDGNAVNGKSIISIVTLNAPKGTRVRIEAEGDDARAAVEALTALIEDGFGEAR